MPVSTNDIAKIREEMQTLKTNLNKLNTLKEEMQTIVKTSDFISFSNEVPHGENLRTSLLQVTEKMEHSAIPMMNQVIAMTHDYLDRQTAINDGKFNQSVTNVGKFNNSQYTKY